MVSREQLVQKIAELRTDLEQTQQYMQRLQAEFQQQGSNANAISGYPACRIVAS